jgi:guanidinobutyrase
MVNVPILLNRALGGSRYSFRSFQIKVRNSSTFNQPLGGNECPRFAGLSTMMRLPYVPFKDLGEQTHDIDVCFLGIPLDIGTSNRSGTRYGPRQIRQESSLIRPYNMATRAAPFDSLMVADVGDVPLNTFNLSASVDIITEHYRSLMKLARGGVDSNSNVNAVVPLTLGGDHTLVLPILRAMKEKYGPISLIHVDAHSDTNDHMFGERIAHGTPIRRAIEEDLIDSSSSFQIGLRGSGYAADDFDWARQQGMTVVPVEECWYKSLAPLMDTVRQRIGQSRPVYISFDIDSLDPSFAPGTGTPEVGGLTSVQVSYIRTGRDLCVILLAFRLSNWCEGAGV